MAVKQIGRYRVTRVLGQGGMGVVYAAYDDRLDRPVAIKVVRNELHADAAARERFRREARAAAQVSHPNICPLYEFDEDNGQPFLVMELLEGESLAARIARGPLPLEEAVGYTVTMLDALAALHRRSIVHRDFKPANVFLTPHGLKLLDFGVAQTTAGDDITGVLKLTGGGVLIGTPQYMAPEQLRGAQADQRADLFAAAAVVYEMLSGRPAFRGQSLAEVLHAVVYAEPDPLPAFPGSAALDRVLRRALEKDPADRIARAEEFSSLVREAARDESIDEAPAPRRVTRFVALPLRVLRPDPETDFLAFSVPDAVSAALAGVASVVVRSPPANLSAAADVRAIGRDLSADVVLTGTILRAGPHVRVSAQLTDTAAGTLLWSDTAQAPIDDLFQLQDTITAHIVSSLSLPLTGTDRRALDRQAPANAEAYELFMRANQLMTDSRQWDAARDLYERAVALDPDYAPAWSGLGRARRVLAKWGGAHRKGLLLQAETAFQRALDLNPDLSSAHDQTAHLDAELGRAPEAMARLLRRAAVRRADPGIFAGLVTTCRYAGLLEASLAAHRRATTLDPAQITSVPWTHFLLGDYGAAMASDRGSLPFAKLLSQLILGQLDREMMDEMIAQAGSVGTRLAVSAYRHIAERDVAAAHAALEELSASGFADPEGWYIYALGLASIGAHEEAAHWLTRSVDIGYGCNIPLTTQRVWEPLRGTAGFDRLVEASGAILTRARRLFDEANGTLLLADSAPVSIRNSGG